MLVTSGISRSAGAQSFEGAHRDKVCVCVFIEVSVRACCKRVRCIKKNKCSGAPAGPLVEKELRGHGET
jgi:hypothetical protein